MKRIVLVGAAVVLATAVGSQAGLLAHYTFDTDGTASAGADATLGTAASIDPTDFQAGGGSLLLSGAPGTETAGDDGAVGGDTFSWGSDIRSVAFFVKATAGDKGDANSTMISLGSGTGAGHRFDVRLTGDNLRLEVQAGGTTTATPIADGTWHHLAVVVPSDGATVATTTYYLDGNLIGAFGGSGTALATGDGPLRMGDSYQDPSRDLKGRLDDVRLYDHALSAGEVAALAAIPEPASLALLGLSAVALTLLRRRR